MSFTVEGVVLPSPDFGDTNSEQIKMHMHRSMTRVVFTYIKMPSDIQKLKYTFSNVTYTKYIELKAVLKAYGATGSITDHNGVTWTVDLLAVVTSIVWDARGQQCGGNPNRHYNQRGTLSLEFEGQIT